MAVKTISQYIDYGFGFPVILRNVPMVKVRGTWTPDLNYHQLGTEVLRALATLEGKLSGNQVKFIRLQTKMTLQQFAKRLGVTHPAVLKWEKSADRQTGMSWSTEKDIRLFIVKSLKGSDKQLSDLYSALELVAPETAPRIKLDVEKVAA